MASTTARERQRLMQLAAIRERQSLMRALLRRMALEVDPQYARLTVLAEEMDVNVQTVLRWITVGRTTATRARALNRRFGNTLADIDTLTKGAR
jgi:integral membrane sensor domain MASE1